VIRLENREPSNAEIMAALYLILKELKECSGGTGYDAHWFVSMVKQAADSIGKVNIVE